MKLCKSTTSTVKIWKSDALIADFPKRRVLLRSEAKNHGAEGGVNQDANQVRDACPLRFSPVCLYFRLGVRWTGYESFSNDPNQDPRLARIRIHRIRTGLELGAARIRLDSTTERSSSRIRWISVSDPIKLNFNVLNPSDSLSTWSGGRVRSGPGCSRLHRPHMDSSSACAVSVSFFCLITGSDPSLYILSAVLGG